MEHVIWWKKMSKYYVFTASIDWADEFDVPFFDIFTESEYNNLKVLAKLYSDENMGYSFGTNEWFDDGFGFDIEGQEATQEEVNVLNKFTIPGYSLLSLFENKLFDLIDETTRDEWYDKYHSLLDVPEDVFQNYFLKENG